MELPLSHGSRGGSVCYDFDFLSPACSLLEGTGLWASLLNSQRFSSPNAKFQPIFFYAHTSPIQYLRISRHGLLDEDSLVLGRKDTITPMALSSYKVHGISKALLPHDFTVGMAHNLKDEFPVIWYLPQTPLQCCCLKQSNMQCCTKTCVVRNPAPAFRPIDPGMSISLKHSCRFL